MKKNHGLNAAVAAVALSGVLLGCGTGPNVKPPEPDELRSIAVANVEPALLWSAKVGDGSKRSVVRYTPYVTTDRVFSVNAKGQITALDRESGTTLWEADTGVNPTAGISGDDRFLYLGSGDGKVFSVDQQDGSVVWSTNVSSEVIAPPTAGAGFIIVRSIDGKVYSLDKESGSRRWIYTYSVPALSLHGNGRPLVLPDGVLVGLDNGRMVALRSLDGNVFWEARLSDGAGRSEIDRLNDLDGHMAINGNSIYAVNYQGSVAQIDPASGNRLWSVDVSSSAGLEASDSLVVVTDEFDTVWALSPTTGQVLWQHEDLSNRQLTAPSITAAGDVLVGDFEGYLHVLSGSTGEQVGRIKATNDQITNKPVISNDTVYLLGRSGKLSAVTL